MKTKVIVLIVALVAVAVSSALAGNSRRVGTAGAPELSIPIGSRGTSMGGAVVANTSGVESIYWNPAGLAMLDGVEVMFSHLTYIADMNVNFGGGAVYVDGFGTIGVSAKVLSVGDMEETTEAMPYGTGRTYNPTYAALGISYARTLTNRVSFGATLYYLNESVFEVRASGVAVDAGFIYEPGWRGLKLGLAIKNYGPEMRFSGRGFERRVDGHSVAAKSAAFDLPSSINMGVSYDLFQEGESQVELSGNFRSNNYSQDYYQGGLEY